MLVGNFVARNNKVEDLKLRVAILESAVACCPKPQKEYASQVHVPKQQHFKEMRAEKEIDNFLWQIEHYIKTLWLYNKKEKV